MIYENLELNIKKGEIVSIVGGGGKTTTLFLLAEELKKLNKKVLVTTTTAIYNPEKDYDYYYLKEIPNEFAPDYGTITIYGEKTKNGKLIGELYGLGEIIGRKVFDFILIEADGSKGKPIKAPANHEPVIIKSTTKTIGIVGLDSLGERIINIAHRPEIFGEIIKKNPCGIIHEEDIVKLALHKEGLFKDAVGDKVLLLNKAHDEKTILRGRKIKELLLQQGFREKIIVTDIKTKKTY